MSQFFKSTNQEMFEFSYWICLSWLDCSFSCRVAVHLHGLHAASLAKMLTANIEERPFPFDDVLPQWEQAKVRTASLGNSQS